MGDKMNNAKFNRIKSRVTTNMIMHQPESVLKKCKFILKVGKHTKIFFKSEKEYEKFVKYSEPKLSLIGERVLVKR